MIDINSVRCGDIVSLCEYFSTRKLYWDVIVEVVEISNDSTGVFATKRIMAKIPKAIWVEQYGKDCLLTHPDDITTFTQSLAPEKFAPEIISRLDEACESEELDSMFDDF